MPLVRPLWSAGTTGAPPTPVLWHRRQSLRPSRVWGTTGALAGVGAGVGVGVGVGGGAGSGACAGAGSAVEPPHPASKASGTMTTTARRTYVPFFTTTFLPVFYILDCIPNLSIT